MKYTNLLDTKPAETLDRIWLHKNTPPYEWVKHVVGDKCRADFVHGYGSKWQPAEILEIIPHESGWNQVKVRSLVSGEEMILSQMCLAIGE